MRRPTMTCWNSGTGRRSLSTIATAPRTSASQAPNSSAFDTVADRAMSWTLSASPMITSSQTAPRKRSAR